MGCPRCGTTVILKRYASGEFNSIFAIHTELSEKQRRYLNGKEAIENE